MTFMIKLKIVRIIYSLTLTLSTFCLLMLQYFIGIRLFREGVISELMIINNVFLISSTILLAIRDIISKNSVYRELVSLILSIVLSLYSFLGSLVDISRLIPGSFIYIPPAFVLIKCSIEINCSSFGAIMISIPLGVSFAIFIFNAYEIFVTYRTSFIEQTSKIVSRNNI